MYVVFLNSFMYVKYHLEDVVYMITEETISQGRAKNKYRSKQLKISVHPSTMRKKKTIP